MLTKIFDKSTFTSHKVIYFTANTYPFNFFKLFFNFLKKQHQLTVSNLFINNVSDWQACQISLEMSFLGQRALYWLHELGTDAKTKQNIYKYLAHYDGPHTILIFANQEDVLDDQTNLKINLDLKTNKDLGNLVKILPSVNHFRILKFIKNMQDHLVTQLNIEQFCLLMQYGALVRDIDEFDLKWVHQIIGSEHSLFTLSKHFLFRDSTAFYTLWAEVCDAYSEQFWIMFFSEQLFRAYWFIIYQKKQDFRLAKQIGFRLPFEFMKTGYNYIDPNVLKSGHDFLYQFDYQLKNGSTNLWLDLFLNKFFKGDF